MCLRVPYVDVSYSVELNFNKIVCNVFDVDYMFQEYHIL